METRLYLYRVLLLDCDGDPKDHGVLRAKGMKAALRIIRDRLQHLYDDPTAHKKVKIKLPVRVYPLQHSDAEGILETVGDFSDHEITVIDYQ